MTEPKIETGPELPGRLGRSPRALQWFGLFVLTCLIVAGLTWGDLPAALLLGPMLGAILLVAAGGKLGVPGPLYAFAQGLIGCLIADTLPLSMTTELAKDWPLLAIGVIGVVLLAYLLGLLVAQTGLLPGSTAVWGLAPGAASVMTVMSEHYGADSRMVAVLLYTRVLAVVAVASLVARFMGIDPESGQSAIPPVIWFPPLDWVGLGETLALAAIAMVLARLLKLPSLALILPILAGIALSHLGWMRLTLPHWLLALAYTLIGWRVGLRFTRVMLLYAVKRLPIVAVCSLLLIAGCGALAWAMAEFGGIDPLTAYLATSPGGVDSIAIIAASSHVDEPFIMAMQMLRFIVLLALGPMIAKFVAGLVRNKA